MFTKSVEWKDTRPSIDDAYHSAIQAYNGERRWLGEKSKLGIPFQLHQAITFHLIPAKYLQPKELKNILDRHNTDNNDTAITADLIKFLTTYGST